jgi:hypothetical protein
MNGPEATALGEWVKIAFYVIGSLAGIAVSLNQFRRRPSVDVDLSSLTTRIETVEETLAKKQDTALCGPAHAAFQATLASILADNDRRDRVTKDQFQAVAVALGELRKEFREDIKGLHKRSDDVLQAVSRLEGKVE